MKLKFNKNASTLADLISVDMDTLEKIASDVARIYTKSESPYDFLVKVYEKYKDESKDNDNIHFIAMSIAFDALAS